MLLKTVKQAVILKNPASCIKVAPDIAWRYWSVFGSIPVKRNPVLEVHND